MTETKAVVRRKAGAIYTPDDQPTRAGDLMSVIRSAALDPRCDTDKMRALLDMAKELEADEAKKAFIRSFHAAQRELPTIARDGKIEIREKDGSGQRNGRVQQQSRYSTYPNMMEVVKPILDAYDLTLASAVRPGTDGRIVVVTTLSHVMGHSKDSEFPLGADTTGSKNNAQGWGSSQQYGMRYNAIALLNIVSKAPQDQDADGHDGRFVNARGGGLTEAPAEILKISKAQREELLGVLEACRVSEGSFCTHYAIAKIEDLPADMFDPAKAAVRKHATDRKATPNG